MSSHPPSKEQKLLGNLMQKATQGESPEAERLLFYVKKKFDEIMTFANNSKEVKKILSSIRTEISPRKVDAFRRLILQELESYDISAPSVPTENYSLQRYGNPTLKFSASQVGEYSSEWYLIANIENFSLAATEYLENFLSFYRENFDEDGMDISQGDEIMFRNIASKIDSYVISMSHVFQLWGIAMWMSKEEGEKRDFIGRVVEVIRKISDDVSLSEYLFDEEERKNPLIDRWDRFVIIFDKIRHRM